MKINFSENKVLYTNNILKWLSYFNKQENTLLISPITNSENILNMKNASVLKKVFEENVNNIENFINTQKLREIATKINEIFNQEIVKIELPFDKLIKNIFEINGIEWNENLIIKTLDILERYSSKVVNVVIAGFQINLNKQFSMLNIFQITNNMQNTINWSNLEQLVILDLEEPLEIIDKDKFKAWLELQTKTVLTIKDLENYFNGKVCFNSFLIEKALKSLSDK